MVMKLTLKILSSMVRSHHILIVDLLFILFQARLLLQFYLALQSLGEQALGFVINITGGGIYLNNSSPNLINLIVRGNIVESANGAGICCWDNSNPVIENVIVADNNGIGGSITNDGSGGISCKNSSPTLNNVLIVNNIGLMSGGMFCNESSNPILLNVTIAGNKAYGSINNNEAAAFISWQNSKPTLINTILWNDSLTEIVVVDSAITIAYSDLQYGLDSIITYNNATVNWREGNIDVYPEFIDTAIGDYHLKNSSPCIGAGIDSLEIGGVWYYCPLFDLEGNPRPNPPGTKPDMGAYESPLSVSGVEDYLSQIPNTYSLEQNFPNPFNPVTKIKYSVPQTSNVVIKVFDILGNEIETLVNEEKQTSSYEITWYAENLPSGIYFYQLIAENFIKSKKMILLK